ncbi:hypothetical protein [Achromobacter aloeverae]
MRDFNEGFPPGIAFALVCLKRRLSRRKGEHHGYATWQNRQPDVLGTDPIVPGMKPDPLPEDPDVYPAGEDAPPAEEGPSEKDDTAPAKADIDERKETSAGPIDLA